MQILCALYVRKNTADPLRQLTIVLIERQASEIAKMRQNQAKMARITCFCNSVPLGARYEKYMRYENDQLANADISLISEF